MNRAGNVYYQDQLAGILSEDDDGYQFAYEEESALTINGKKNRLKRTDFDELAQKLGIPAKASERVYTKLATKKAAMLDLIERSFLPDELKGAYANLLVERARRIDVS